MAISETTYKTEQTENAPATPEEPEFQTVEINGESVEISAEYNVTRRASFPSQRALMSAWQNMDFPAHNAGRSYTGTGNFRGRAFPDGSGEVMHYRTLAAIRTRNGLVINNRQDWAGGFATVTSARRADASLPLTGINGLLERGEDVRDITHIMESSGGPTVVYLSSGAAVAVLTDRTASGPGVCGLRLEPEEAREIRVASDVLELLKPASVREAEREGMGISERPPNQWGVRNGETIYRQGEWFFLPTDKSTRDLGTVEKPYSDLYLARKRWARRRTEHPVTGRHIPRDFARPLPRECDTCGESSFAMDNDGEVTCEVCGEGDHGVYVRGTVRHAGGDHPIYNLRERWFRAVRHDRDVMVFDMSAGRGSGGWD